ncbi:MAG: hypothetical protein WB607_01855, partial [Candidatus Acidiferrum sp.]
VSKFLFQTTALRTNSSNRAQRIRRGTQDQVMREKVKIVSRFGKAIAGFALQGVIEQNQNGLENRLRVGMKENYPLDVIQ